MDHLKKDDKLSHTLSTLNQMSTEEFERCCKQEQEQWKTFIKQRLAKTSPSHSKERPSLFDITRITQGITNPIIIEYILTRLNDSQQISLNHTLYQHIQQFFDDRLIQHHPNHPTHLLLLATSIFFNLRYPIDSILQLGRLLNRGGMYLQEYYHYPYSNDFEITDQLMTPITSREAARRLLMPIISEYTLHNHPTRTFNELTQQFEKRLTYALIGRPLQSSIAHTGYYGDDYLMPNQLFMWGLHTWMGNLRHAPSFKYDYDQNLTTIIKYHYPSSGHILIDNANNNENKSVHYRTLNYLQGKFLLYRFPPALLTESIYCFQFSKDYLPKGYQELFRQIQEDVGENCSITTYHKKQQNWSLLAEKNLLVQKTLTESNWPEECLTYALLKCLTPTQLSHDIKKHHRITTYTANQYINKHLNDIDAIECIIKWIEHINPSNETALNDWIIDRYKQSSQRKAFIKDLYNTIQKKHPHLIGPFNDFFNDENTALNQWTESPNSRLFSQKKITEEKWTEMTEIRHAITS